MITLEAFVKTAGEMPALPTIYHEVKNEVDNPRSTIESISDIICKDQVLTTRLLRLANSAIYGFSTRIETIQEALQMIGIGQMKDLALMTSVINSFKSLPDKFVTPAEFWSHSIASALASKEVAALNNDRNMERYFVGGLLHDIGRLVMYIKLPEQSLDVLNQCRENGEQDTVVESRVIGFNHAELGGMLVEMWKLPKIYVEVIRYHHKPSLAQMAKDEVAIIHFADFFVSALELGTSGEFYVPPFMEDAWKLLEVSEDTIPDLLQRIDESGREMIHTLLGR